MSDQDGWMSCRYFRRRWDERRGDQYDAWGWSTWLFETDYRGNVLRQIEIYDGGQRLRYDERNARDQFGGLSKEPLDVDEFLGFEIAADEFESAWNTPG